MGYYVSTRESNFIIPVANLGAAYQAMCALNHDSDIEKRGGSWSGGKMQEAWFSWMSPDYDETCEDAFDVLREVGFEPDQTDDGDLVLGYYNSKSGQEALFLAAIAPYAVPGSFVIWEGEEGEIWRDIVVDGKIVTSYAELVFKDREPVGADGVVSG